MSKYQIPPVFTRTTILSGVVFALLLGRFAYFYEQPVAGYWPLWALSGGLVGLCVGMLSQLNVLHHMGKYEGDLWQLAIIWGVNRGAVLGACMALFVIFTNTSLGNNHLYSAFSSLEELLSLMMGCIGWIAVISWWAVARAVRREQSWDPGRGKSIFFSMFWGVFTCALINFGQQLEWRDWTFEPQMLLWVVGVGALLGAIWGSLKPL